MRKSSSALWFKSRSDLREIAEGGARESYPFRLTLIGYLPAVGSAFAAVTATGCPAAEAAVLPGAGLIDVERPSV